MACLRESEEGKTAVRELISTGAEVGCSGFILVGTSCQKMKKDRLKQSARDRVQPVLWKGGRITEYEKGEAGRSAFVFTVFYIVATATPANIRYAPFPSVLFCKGSKFFIKV